MNDVDLVVLVDAQGNPTGTAPKSTVHTHDTPLHLAFSCYVLGPDGKILVTRRALSKKHGQAYGLTQPVDIYFPTKQLPKPPCDAFPTRLVSLVGK
ncbi:Isopentenyl-diphosphate delta-isomerase [Corynebacterium pseudotuberculosis]|nr:Isopentenyl-diphosphate delta-isomerase [Corynebacterium pseudotuberculosis]AIG09682.1 Isopentenyl-diphosphate delta-isomerase [Corynebacterium pseudotuberculosis]AIG12420.1 Isopentenyl-diphosphate delta-isomerase [Corynebacterium pseudotuberculosis]